MKFHAILGLVLFIAALGACGGGGGGDDGGPPAGVADFRHFTTTETVQDRWTVLDHPLANGNPDAVVFVTHNWNPAGTVGTYHDHMLGVAYESSTGRWNIRNLDGDPMPLGVYFNVTIVSRSASAWTHVTETANIVLDRTLLDHASLNGAPSTLSIVTKNVTPIGMIAVTTSDFVGTWYDGAQWTVFLTRLGARMIEDQAFNVHALPADGSSFVHTAIAPGGVNWTPFSHPDADGNPNAIIQVTATYGTGVYNNRAVGVFYLPLTNLWGIFNEDESPLPADTAYVVRVRP